MAEIQTGKGHVKGIANDGTDITITGVVGILDSTKIQHKFKLGVVEDEYEFDASLSAVNGHREMDVVWVPASTTKSAAYAGAVFLDPFDAVTLDNFLAPNINGTWIYIGDASLDLTHGPAKMSMKLRRYDDTAQNTSLSTTVAS